MPVILIVEDHPLLRQSLCDVMARRFPDHRIVPAEDGEEAIALAGELRPAAVVIDLKLPGISGLAATAAIKKAVPETRVVVHSIFNSPALRRQASTAGADAYVAKDEGIARLVRTIRTLTRAASPRTDAE